FHVTGVQTCALPIYRKSRRYHLRHCTTDTPNPTPIASAIEVGSAGSDEFARSLLLLARERGKLLLHKAHHQRVEVFHTVAALRRSEERRVGKESRTR